MQEALARAAAFPHLDEERVRPFLFSVVRRLAIDQQRREGREARYALHGTLLPPQAAPPEEQVCSRKEADWVAHLVASLPERDRYILWARADGESLRQIAAELNVSTKAVEAALARARKHLRVLMSATRTS